MTKEKAEYILKVLNLCSNPMLRKHEEDQAAIADAETINQRYQDLKRDMSFLEANHTAVTEWLMTQ